MKPNTETSARPQATPPSRSQIEAQLSRLTASLDFRAPERARQFLRYVVGETLDGRGDRIKAYSIAIEVFGRDQSFDAQNDPVVRIEAGRLRRALERYYLTAGQADPITIDIPKGGYVPVFLVRSLTPSANAADRPAVIGPRLTELRQIGTKWRSALIVGTSGAIGAVLGGAIVALLPFALNSEPHSKNALPIPDGPVLVVAPFTDLGEESDSKLYAAGLTEEIVAQLARFKEITILGRETSAAVYSAVDTTRLQRDVGARFALEGSVRVTPGDRLRVTGRLLDAETGIVLWSKTYDNNLRVQDIVAIEQDVAQKVATAIAQPYGIIFRAASRRAEQKPPADVESYGCTLRFYAYRNELSAVAHDIVRACLERAVARFPDYSTAWAMLSFLYLDEMRFGFNPRSDEPLARRRALDAAQTAVRLDPDNVRALQAEMATLFFMGQLVEARRVGEQALLLNPNDAELLGEYGSRVALSGDWARGMELLDRALALNAGNAGFYKGILALAAYMQGDADRAVGLIQKADLQKFALYHAVAAIIYAEQGMIEDATAARALFLKMRPDFFDHFDAELAKRGIAPADRARLADGARKASFPLPEAHVVTVTPSR